MTGLIEVVKTMAMSLTFASFFSGTRVCYVMYSSPTNDHISVVPFLGGLTCTALWLNYGLVGNQWEIMIVNCVGIIFQLIYILLFTIFTKNRRRTIKLTLSTVLILTSLYYFNQVLSNETGIKFAGYLACTSSFVASLSTLATIKEVIKTKNVSSLPFTIILSTCLVSFFWMLYGELIDDKFVRNSNLAVSLISGSQMILFLIYPATLYEKLPPADKKTRVSKYRSE